MLTNEQKEKISLEVIKTMITASEYLHQKDFDVNNSFLCAFAVNFTDKLNWKISDTPAYINWASWLHGLNTTLGQSFFEKVAHILCSGEKREYTAGKLRVQKITQTQKENITSIITELKNSNTHPDLQRENDKLFYDFNTPLVDALGFSADVYYETDE